MASSKDQRLIDVSVERWLKFFSKMEHELKKDFRLTLSEAASLVEFGDKRRGLRVNNFSKSKTEDFANMFFKMFGKFPEQWEQTPGNDRASAIRKMQREFRQLGPYQILAKYQIKVF